LAIFSVIFLPKLVFAAEPINIGIIAEQGALESFRLYAQANEFNDFTWRAKFALCSKALR